MSDDNTIEVMAEDLQMIADQVAVNPPDGPIRIIQQSDGNTRAEWVSEGSPASVGPAITKPLPDDVRRAGQP